MPIIWVEQYPKGLGETIPELKELFPNQVPIEKCTFNALENKEFQKKVAKYNKTQWLVCGIEAHICVYQTVLGLLKNYKVELVTDCISSREKEAVTLTINKLQKKGVGITNVEMCLFELIKDAKKEVFKKILPLIK